MTGRSGEIDPRFVEVITSMGDLELESAFFNSLNDEQRRQVAESIALVERLLEDDGGQPATTVTVTDLFVETPESLKAGFIDSVNRDQAGEPTFDIFASLSEDQSLMLGVMAMRRVGEISIK